MPDPANEAYTEDLRQALLGQVAYLTDEVEVLRKVIDLVPETLLDGRPLDGDRSIKEMFGLLAARDEMVYLPFFRRVVAEDEPDVEVVDEDELVSAAAWNDFAIDDLLQRLHETRMELVEALRALPIEKWSRAGVYDGERLDVFQLAHSVAQHDADLLRAVGYRLHSSSLSSRPQQEGLP